MKNIYQYSTLGELVDGDRERIADVLCPVIERAAAGAEDRARDHVDHEVAEKVQALDGCLSGDTLENLAWETVRNYVGCSGWMTTTSVSFSEKSCSSGSKRARFAGM